MELDWVTSPMPKEASTANRAKELPRARPRALGRMPRAMTNMGPPAVSPGRRNLTARAHSANLAARPNRAAISIHTRAPGPPAVMAVATPTILPVPMVAARAVMRVERGETRPRPAERDSRRVRSFRAGNRFRQGRNPMRRVKNTPVPSRAGSVTARTAWAMERDQDASIRPPPFSDP